MAYDELREDCPKTADRQYLKILQRAATSGEQLVERALHQLLEQGRRIRAEQVEEVLQESGWENQGWQIEIDRVKLSVYDRLLGAPAEVRT